MQCKKLHCTGPRYRSACVGGVRFPILYTKTFIAFITGSLFGGLVISIVSFSVMKREAEFDILASDLQDVDKTLMLIENKDRRSKCALYASANFWYKSASSKYEEIGDILFYFMTYRENMSFLIHGSKKLRIRLIKKASKKSSLNAMNNINLTSNFCRKVKSYGQKIASTFAFHRVGRYA